MDEKKQPLVVSPPEAGQKLLSFLARRTGAPSGELHRWIRTGQVRVNGARAKAFDRLEEGALVRVPPFAIQESVQPSPEKTPAAPLQGAQGKLQGLSVLYEDEHLLILEKPAGITVQGGSGHADNLAARVAGAFAGAILTETIFSWPGLGTLIVNAVNGRDYALIQGVVLFSAVVFVFVNLVVDIVYMIINPKVSYEGGAR